MLNCSQLTEFIIKPALYDLQLDSEVAIELMVFTCATESEGGYYLKQVEGPALGIYQMEPATYNDIWQNYIKGRGSLAFKLMSNFGCPSQPPEDQLIYDLRFATAMCRLHYARVPAALPSSTDPILLWNYYKQHYNTPQGKAEAQSSIAKYHRFKNLLQGNS